MHSKKHRQVRKLKLRSKSKSRRGRSLKGGAKPYEYEGVSLEEGNRLIQIAVTEMEDGTYTFNPVGKNFTNYCELAKYYCDNKSLACVNSAFPSRDMKKKNTYPSLIQLLGLSLILAKSHKIATMTSTPIKDDEISENILTEVPKLNKNEPFLKPPVSDECTSYNGLEFFKISDISKVELDIILATMKRLMFFSKYAVVADNRLTDLTFANILDTDTASAISYVNNQNTFRTNVAATNFNAKKNMFTQEQLNDSAASASAASASAPVPAPVPASAPLQASLEDRVAKLETAVADLQNK